MIRKEDVVLRLNTLGYNADNGDTLTLEMSIRGTEEYIKNYCNIKKIPCRLYNTAVDMCCGVFLKTKNSIGALEGYDVKSALVNVTEGDVSISYGKGTSSQELFNMLIDKLTDKEGLLVCCRKLSW